MDYYVKVSNLSEDELLVEIERINKMLFKANNSSTRSQLQDMLRTAEAAYQEAMFIRRVKNEDTVIEIGSIESSVKEPDYTKKELLDVIVTGYTKGLRNESN